MGNREVERIVGGLDPHISPKIVRLLNQGYSILFKGKR